MFGFGKGKIEIILEKYNFKPGETIKGKLKLKMNKPTKAKALKVTFAGIKNTRNSGITIGNQPRNKNNSTTEYVHKFEMPLDGEKEYSSGEYDFEILVPSDILSRSSGPGGDLGTALQAVQFLSGGSTRVEWSIQGTLDIEKSLDVNKKVQINIG
ncbi:hypothetical protein KKB11_05345 [Candidatus Micrarchaeota archaeon]|nr:hypothetical protein [Candidatus Micrarchaeota archaeon]